LKNLRAGQLAAGLLNRGEEAAMKSVRVFLVLAVAIVGIAYLVFSSSSHPGNPNVPKPAERDVDDLIVGEPIQFRNLTIFPVSSKSPRRDDRFITLDEGLKAGTVEVFEKGAAPAPNESADNSQSAAGEPVDAPPVANADPFAVPAANPDSQDPFAPASQSATPTRSNAVNELMIVNHSARPLYLMPGEIIIGGSQDRTVGQELVIAPDNKPVPMSVFCVEHGRWGGRDVRTYASLLAATRAAVNVNAAADSASFDGLAQTVRGTLRADSWDDVGGPGDIDSFRGNLSLVVSQTTEVANAGKFIGSIGSLSKDARIAVQSGEGQGKVWDEVATENAKSGVKYDTGTFSANYADPASSERLTPYVEGLNARIAKTPNVVGVIVAVNGQMHSLDVFESTPLFLKLWPKLLKSYALDAANNAADNAAPKTATHEEADRFLKDVADLRGAASDAVGDLAVAKGQSDDIIAFSAHDRRNPRDLNADGEAVAAPIGTSIHCFGGMF
jgi:hypothetical protein